ncbi:MAG: RNA methyltransferase [Lachnospiraceae bacterium]|nr:RNA methyltransferase [Lachnospiraceae bacterium]
MLPELFLERMKNMLGKEYDAFLASFEQDKYQALRLNALKKDRQGRCAAEVLKSHLSKVSWAENGYYYAKEEQPGKHPYHEAGFYYIQEPSAMAPVTLLEVCPGDRILDLCAAPGGKSTQIAAALQGEGLLICNEIHPARAKILSENIERMGIRNACVTNETPARLAEVFPEYFDRILVDAPCSGEGMFRKNEAACEEWSLENVEMCASRQDEILDCAARMLRPGGRLVYSTCTFAPRENEGSISRLIERYPEFTILPADAVKRHLSTTDDAVESVSPDGDWRQKKASEISYDGVPAWVDNPAPGIEHTLRLWPHYVKGEGHYAAVLQKAGQATDTYKIQALGGLEKGLSQKEMDKEWADYQVFVKENLTNPLSGKYLRFGDNLYLIPEEMPSVKGLKVLRPGLHVGTLKKNRFEPSHALALALEPQNALHVWNLSSEDTTVNAYISGQTFSAEGEKGWYLICVDGFSIGWGKLAGGIMKNHYPKGLRKNL